MVPSLTARGYLLPVAWKCRRAAPFPLSPEGAPGCCRDEQQRWGQAHVTAALLSAALCLSLAGCQCSGVL